MRLARFEREGKSRIGFFDDSTVACSADAAQASGGELGSSNVIFTPTVFALAR